MISLEELRALQSEVTDARLGCDGFGLWLAWSGEMNTVVVQTLEDYGGVSVARTGGQALWFFFSGDVFLAAARLAVWARFNPLQLTMQLFPVAFKLGPGMGSELIFDPVLEKQSVDTPTSFSVWVDSSLASTVEGIPGLSLAAQAPPAGFAARMGNSLEADARLPYQSSLGWYIVLRPVGNPLDKAFQAGWREMFGHVESILQRNKFRFILHDFNLMFPLEGLRQFRNWCREFLQLILRLKAEHPEHYWPCVMIVVDKKGLNFNNDLPQKLSMDFDKLTPDYPHMFKRNALMLGEEFSLHEVRFAASGQHPDDWCSVSLSITPESGTTALPNLTPATLAPGENIHCFYCGQRSHKTADCPTRHMSGRDEKVWSRMAVLDFAAMRQSVQAIDKRMKENPESAAYSLASEDKDPGVVYRAFYDLTWETQLRATSLFWRLREKDLKKSAATSAPEDASPLWQLCRDWPTLDPVETDKELQDLQVRNPRDFRVTSLRGFLALERDDLAKAQAYWKEAELASSYPVVQAWHLYLQGRLLEYRGKNAQASLVYDQVHHLCPTWMFPEYRRLVCEVKSGFAERAAVGFAYLVAQDGHYFNKMLLDPELERGQIQIAACLQRLWNDMETLVTEERGRLHAMHLELPNWFMPDNPFAAKAEEKIALLLQTGRIANYVAYQNMCAGRAVLDRDIQRFVSRTGKEYKALFTSFVTRLDKVHQEAAWFPFPGIMVDFNKSFNHCSTALNWALKANFHMPDSFKKAQGLATDGEERLVKLEKKMRFLRMVRDSTLFLLSVAESFLWIEAIGIVFIFALLPLLLFYGDKIGLDITASAIARQRWEVQKALFFVISVVALGVACLRTVLRFERIRDKVFSKAQARQKVRAKKVGKPPAAKA